MWTNLYNGIVIPLYWLLDGFYSWFGVVCFSYLEIVPPHLLATPKQNNKMSSHEKCSCVRFGWMLEAFDEQTNSLMHNFMAIISWWRLLLTYIFKTRNVALITLYMKARWTNVNCWVRSCHIRKRSKTTIFIMNGNDKL